MPTLTALRVRLFVLLGVLALLIAATALVFLSRAQRTATPPQPAVTTAKTPVAHQRAVHPARPVVHHPAAVQATLPSGFPTVLHRALERRAVVVVSLVVGGGTANEAAVAEARAGAAASGSAFMRVDLGHNGLAHAFATLVGGDTQLPATLVVKRPGSVSVRFDGYEDRAIVAQAAHDARA